MTSEDKQGLRRLVLACMETGDYNSVSTILDELAHEHSDFHLELVQDIQEAYYS